MIHSHRVVSCCLATFQPSNWLGDQAGFPVSRKDRGPSAAGRCSVLPWETLAPVTIVAPDAGRTWPPSSSSKGGNCSSYSSLGYSLPNLHVTGQAGPVASWGGTLNVTAILQNTGASTINEPLSLVPPGQIADRARRPARPAVCRSPARPTSRPTRSISIVTSRPRAWPDAIRPRHVRGPTSGTVVTRTTRHGHPDDRHSSPRIRSGSPRPAGSISGSSPT